MHPDFLSILVCPETGEPFRLEAVETISNGMIISGSLVTASGRCYPIVRGIPRFVSAEKYASSFGYEWNRWPRLQFEAENTGRPMEGYTTRMWDINVGPGKSSLQDQTIVEFGCGPGRFLDVVRCRGGRAVGVELSQAVETARRNFADDKDVLIVQADLFNPPFRANAFDGGYSIGVLHHTPDPQQGLRALARIVRQGGWTACCVYPQHGFYDYSVVTMYRRISNWLKPALGYRPALAYAYLSAYLLTPLLSRIKRIRFLKRLVAHLTYRWLVVLDLPDVRWRVLDIFDAITPAIATTHTNEEVKRWMEQAGCTDVETTAWCPTSVVATKI